MSYCRWSSDGWKSDLYVYEDVNGGWTSHVAANRRAGLESLPEDPYTLENIENMQKPEWRAAYNHYHDVLGNLPMVEINHELAGKSFNDPTAKACAQRLKLLKAEGFHVPDGVIEELEREEEDDRQGKV